MNSTEVKPGDGATYHIGSDRYPFTIVSILSSKKIQVQRDEYKRVDKNGFSENQTYEYTSVPNARLVTITQRKDGRWYEQGSSMGGSGFYSLGVRKAYQDPSF